MMYRLPEPKIPDALLPFGGSISRDLRGTKVGDVWYVLESATVFEKEGVIRATFFDPDGTINCGLMVCNWRRGERTVPAGEFAPDGQGATVPSEAMGAQFDLYAGSHFTPPALGPHAIFAAREAWIETVVGPNDIELKFLRWRGNRSDAFSGLGNLNAKYTRIALKFRGVVLREKTVLLTREDAIRDEAYQRRGGAFYNPGAALQVEAGKRGLGAVLTDELRVEFGGIRYVAQGFAEKIIATEEEHYADDDFFLVSWGNG